MIKEPIDAIADYLTSAEALIIYADNYLAYLGRPEFPQSYHNLWKAHIQAMRTLQQTSFDFLPSTSGTDSGRLSLQDYIRTTRDTHVLIYPELDEYRRYRRILQSYSEYVHSWQSPANYCRFVELRKLQVARTRRRLLSQTWKDIWKYGVCTPPLLDLCI
jgi:hypothetical protein